MEKLLPVNEHFKPLMNNQSRYLLLMGGAGSGKSYFTAQKLLHRIMNEDDHRILFCRKVGRTIRNSQFLQFKDLIRDMGKTKEFVFSQSRMDITYKVNNNQLISAGLDDPEKLKSLTKPTGIWIEEATECTMDDFRQLDLRLRGVDHTYLQLILSFNPISKAHWLYELFVAGQKPDTTINKSTYRSNEFIDAEFSKMVERLKEEDPDYYQVYGRGEWGDYAKGLIYRYKTVDEMPPVDEVFYGLDFGFNNATALVKVGVKEEELYLEETIYQKGLTNNDLISLMKQEIPNKNAEIYADAAEPARIEEIFRAGFNIKPAEKSVKDGIDHVKRYRIYVSKSAPNIIKELDGYRWKENMKGYTLDEPLKLNDHACDAFRYAVHTHFRGKKSLIHGFA